MTKDKLKMFLKKYKIILTIILLLIASTFIYLFVSAEDDPYADKIEVTNASVEIKDGTEPFDSNDDEPGNDSSDSNKKVRNFDQITYNVKYSLAFKSEYSAEDHSDAGITRKVIIDVLVPSTLKADVAISVADVFDSGENKENITINEIEYKYYQFEYADAKLTEENDEEIVISNINSTNDTQIQPIIRVREKTDTSKKDIENENIMEELDSINVDPVTVTAKDSYGVKLFSSNVIKDEDSKTTYPIGIVIYLPNDPNKGIKGIQIPKELSFNLTAKSSSSNPKIINLQEEGSSNPTIGNYDKNKYLIENLPESYEDNNGDAGLTVSSINGEDNTSTFQINYTNLQYDFNELQSINLNSDSEEENMVKYISSKVLTFKTEKDPTIRENITYTVTTDASSNQIQMIDNYEPFVGDYLSKIDFVNSSNITNSSDGKLITTTPGEATYNYNEEFYIRDTITYGVSSGDTLDKGLTNYIKIDNTAMRLIDVGNISNQDLDYFLQMSSANESQKTDSDSYTVSYGVGKWDQSYFKVKSNAPTYCPNNLSNVSKEDLMNYYGGPCIEENESVKWYDSIASATQENESNADNIILFKFNFNGEYYPATQTTILLKARVLNNTGLVGKTYQVVSRGLTTWNGNSYYLSETPRQSVSNQTADLKYIKSEYYSKTDGEKMGTIKENTNVPSNKYGNTIYVTPFKDYINSIKINDVYDSEKDVIYSGLTDPMEIIINPVVYKSDMDASITGATVTLYIPDSLIIYNLPEDKVPVVKNQQTIDGVVYNVYDYIYTEDDIKYDGESSSQTIPNLIVHAYISIDTVDNTQANIMSTISATLKSNNESSTIFDSITSIASRTAQKTVTLRNTKKISSLGRIGTAYIDVNGSYEYNMRAVNLTGENATLELLYILPYTGDGVGDGSKFDGTQSIYIVDKLPAGYKAYYTNDASQTIINNEIGKSSTIKWTEWSNYNQKANNITAIKIVADTPIQNEKYFIGENGITLSITTSKNKESDEYYNNFYILHKGVSICHSENDNDCDENVTGTMSYASNISSISVYNRTISGQVFEDYDYNGLYSQDEKKLNDIVVELYKLNNKDYKSENSRNPLSVITQSDELIEDTVTNSRGNYSFRGLKSDNYYVKYTFDCDKYTVTEKNKENVEFGDTSLIDSDADMIASDSQSTTCSAVSNIITLDNNRVQVRNIDLGLRIRQNFDITIKKYITNVKVTSNKGVQSYDYNNESKVKVDVKNLKNTSFRVTYGFEIENTKYFPGTIGNIVETLPEGMTFDPTLPENDGWYESDGILYYSYLNKTLILPGQKYHMTIVLDLVTDSGGDYINLVSAGNLRIMQTTTNYLEVVDPESQEQDSSTNTDNEKED